MRNYVILLAFIVFTGCECQFISSAEFNKMTMHSPELRESKAIRYVTNNTYLYDLSNLKTGVDTFYTRPDQQLELTVPDHSKYHHITYKELRDLCVTEKKEVINNDTLSKAEIYELSSTYFTNTLADDIFPYWYGTVWDFNGTTEVPRTGKVACGYFVSTTLKHVGFNLNRYRVAQQASGKIIKLICGRDNVATFTTVQDMVQYLMKKDDGLYLVGLSMHVGFLQKRNNKVYFIHSSYVSPHHYVIKEIASGSPALNSSDIFVIGSLSHNPEVIKKWVNNDFIATD